jgi:murein DD-endopeptidase MepM/ murein hydrolase activator NlpD
MAFTSPIVQQGQVLLAQTLGWVKAHPRQLTAAVAALWLAAAGGAYAVANLGPDVASLPVTMVQQPVPTPEMAPLPHAAGGLALYRSETSRSNDTADTLLRRLGVDDVAAAQFLRTDGLTRQYLLGRAGRQVTALTEGRQGLGELSARWAASDDSGLFNRLLIRRTAKGFSSELQTAPMQVSNRLASGSIESSLFAATDAAGLPDGIASQLAEIFSGDIDFRRALRKGDRFNVVYESLEADGEPLKTGRVLSAEFVNAGRSHQAVWFSPEVGHGTGTQMALAKGGYYNLKGESLKRAFLSSPVQFSRVSSGFAMRFHPILQMWRQHLGTDFAAPTGTPARTVGDGVVSFAGWQNGYGNVVFIQHRSNTVTVYAHMSQLLVRRGQTVSQGQTIGLVGATGWATGPHLHFEVRVDGVQKDPMAMAQRSETVPLDAVMMPAFHKVAERAQAELTAAASAQPARFE